jgi:hypothetical protein
MLALDDLYDASFSASIRPAMYDACENPVAVHRVVYIVARNEEIAFDAGNRRVGHNESVAFPVRDHSPGDEIRVLRALRSFCASRAFRVGVFYTCGMRRSRFMRDGRLLWCALARQAVAVSTLFDFALAFELLHNARQEPPAGVLQTERMRDFANARGL